MPAITYTERAIAEAETLIDYMSVITMLNRDKFAYHIQTGNCYITIGGNKTAVVDTSIKRFYETLCLINVMLKDMVDRIHGDSTQEDETGEGGGDEED